jgi:hypothetical protein
MPKYWMSYAGNWRMKSSRCTRPNKNDQLNIDPQDDIVGQNR